MAIKWKHNVAKLYVQVPFSMFSVCIETENKKYIDICLCTYLRNETEEINWSLCEEA